MANNNAILDVVFITFYMVGNCKFSTELDYEILWPLSYNLCCSHN